MKRTIKKAGLSAYKTLALASCKKREPKTGCAIPDDDMVEEMREWSKFIKL